MLASLPSLRELFDTEDDLAGLAKLEAAVAWTHPEDVNDGANTAPSKRLLAYIPGYRKLLHGPEALERAGLATMRGSCPGFHAWVTQLEALGRAT